MRMHLRLSECHRTQLITQHGVHFCSECLAPCIGTKVMLYKRFLILLFIGLLLLCTKAVKAPNLTYFPVCNWAKIDGTLIHKMSDVDYIQVCMIESGGDSSAISIEGAIGIMQLMPVTLTDWNNQHPNEKYTLKDIKRKRVNIKIGVWMLKKRIPELLKFYKLPDAVNHRLICYNWGIGYFKSWYEKGADYRRLPDETKCYIIKYWQKY